MLLYFDIIPIRIDNYFMNRFANFVSLLSVTLLQLTHGKETRLIPTAATQNQAPEVCHCPVQYDIWIDPIGRNGIYFAQTPSFSDLTTNVEKYISMLKKEYNLPLTITYKDRMCEIKADNCPIILFTRNGVKNEKHHAILYVDNLHEYFDQNTVNNFISWAQNCLKNHINLHEFSEEDQKSNYFRKK